MTEVRTNLGDPQLELIDPTPNVYTLFVLFDGKFFGGKLGARAVAVRWSKRMYSCAGICRYEGSGGLCEVALSEPLLKLRPRKDLVETLLHEMIHAFLFLTERDRDRDGHGPNFQRHMHRINAAANLNISIYHSFHDEVRLYQTHWWRCSGPCQTQKPYFGIVRRSCNRAPGPNDFWWATHQANCGGKYVKIKEPEKNQKSKVTKPKESITKYVGIITKVKTLADVTSPNENRRKTVEVKNKSPKNGSGQILDANENTIVNVRADKGNTLKTTEVPEVDVVLAVRNHWASKDFNKKPLNNNAKINNKRKSAVVAPPENNSPPSKIKKINDFFPASTNRPDNFTKKDAETILKDIYGEDFTLYKPTKKNATSTPKLIAVKALDGSSIFVNCPSCNKSIKDSEINDHLDICLNSQDHKDNLIDLTETDSSRSCPVCNKTVLDSLEDHLEMCLLGFDSDNFSPDCPSTSTSGPSSVNTVSLNNDDRYVDIDESKTFNESGTMHPCPCCMLMVEADLMNRHIDECLNNIYLANLANKD